MMEYMKGALIEASPVRTIMEVAGIGYRILTSLSTYAKLPPIGTTIQLYLSTVIREDSHKTYGFLSTEERDVFEILIEISGIGPKTALSLLGHLDPAHLQQAITRADISSICKVPGIGKKTAERLIVEMKDKVQKTFPPSLPKHPGIGIAQDATSALLHLGYHPASIQKALDKALSTQPEEPDLTTLITQTLKLLSSS